MMEQWLEQFATAAFERSSDTAHDLKTPLNVAVLNLELLRMRVRKLNDGEEDEKVGAYTRAIELELRRMARIFDAFFLLSTPPKNEGAPVVVELAEAVRTQAEAVHIELRGGPAGDCIAHESRAREAVRYFFEAAARLLAEEDRRAVVADTKQFSVSVSGRAAVDDLDITKIFKFYYTDPFGNPDLSLATARLIAESYGGDVTAEQEGDRLSLRMSFPGEP